MRVIFAILSAVASLPAQALAQPVFEVRGGSFPPGKTDGFVDIWLRPDNGQLISGWNLLLRYNPSAIAGVSIASTRSADLFNHTDQNLFTEPGTVSAATVYSLAGD